MLAKYVHTRRGSYVCGTSQRDGDREEEEEEEEEEEGHTDTDRPGLRPRLHSYTDKASHTTCAA